jgi:hypothetical protein
MRTADIARHYTTLHYTTLHYTTLHYITLHYTTLHYTTLHYTTLHYTTLHYTTHIIQLMNVYECNGKNIFMRWKMECSIQLYI